MAVYDVFPFFNELDILEIRLETLDPIVDYFVITECTTTFSGTEKPLYFQDNVNLFSKFRSKIIHQVVDGVPDLDPFGRDRYQRDSAKVILEDHCVASDIILYGDVDEIPHPNAAFEGMNSLNSSVKIAHLAQDLFYYYLNVKEVSRTLLSHTGEYPRRFDRKWLGSNVSSWSYASQFLMTDLRNPEHKRVGRRISRGGWHFSYVGSANKGIASDRVRHKVQSSAHQELNNQEVLEELNLNLDSLKDIFGRRWARFKIQEEFGFLPQYVQNNLEKFRYLILT